MYQLNLTKIDEGKYLIDFNLKGMLNQIKLRDKEIKEKDEQILSLSKGISAYVKDIQKYREVVDYMKNELDEIGKGRLQLSEKSFENYVRTRFKFLLDKLKGFKLK